MKKTEKLKLQSLEAWYSFALAAELRRCAEGRWGLFGQNDLALRIFGKHPQAKGASAEVEEILALGEKNLAFRRKLGNIEAFEPHARLLHLRSLKGDNRLGEPTLAKQWLLDMSTE